MLRRQLIPYLFVLGLIIAPNSWAYLHVQLPYDSMARTADVVVVASPVSRLEMTNSVGLPGVRGASNQPIPAVEIHTTFRTVVCFKGDVEEFVLVHFREVEQEDGTIQFSGPHLVDFKPSEHAQFLMFLRRRSDGRFESVLKADPGLCIEQLRKKLVIKEEG